MELNKIKEVILIIDELRNTGSTNLKEKILIKNKNNEVLKTILELTYNPHKKYGISEKILNEFMDKTNAEPVEVGDNIFLIFDKLAKNNINDDLRFELSNILLNIKNVEVQELFKCIVLKDLKIGIGKTTINKVWKNLIPSSETNVVIKPMLASKFDFNKIPNDDLVVTEKLDGIRCVAICKEDGVELYTRQGKLIEGCIEIEQDLEVLRKYLSTEVDKLRYKCKSEFVFDGELLAKDCDYSTVYKETTKRVKNKNEIKTGIEFKIFDILDYEEFENNKCNRIYSERMFLLHTLDIMKCDEVNSVSILRPIYIGKDIDKILGLLDEYKNKGAEGLMVNLYNGLYEFKRSKNILKLKTMQTADLRVVDYEEGNGKNKGKLGALIVEFIHNNNIYTCKVGSGFSDEERVLYWNNIDLVMDKIVEIQFFEITNNSNNEYSLRFPVWLGRVRNDKNEISMY